MNQEFQELVEAVRKQIKEMGVEELQNKLHSGTEMYLIDIREDNEWNTQVRLPKALHIGRGVLEKQLSDMVHDKQSLIVLYCAGGIRSVLAAKSLQELNYHNVYSLKGGITAWQGAGYPLS